MGMGLGQGIFVGWCFSSGCVLQPSSFFYFLADRLHHISQSSGQCSKCCGRHHTSICSNSSKRSVTGTSPRSQAARSPSIVASGAVQVPITSSVCVNSPTPILLQTAKAVVYDASQPESTPTLEVRVILDLGSQTSYVTARVWEALSIRNMHPKKDCGAVGDCDQEWRTLDSVRPHICEPVHLQPI